MGPVSRDANAGPWTSRLALTWDALVSIGSSAWSPRFNGGNPQVVRKTSAEMLLWGASMNCWCSFSALFIAACMAAVPLMVRAQEAPEKLLFAEPKKDWEWDEDKRFDFLMERLASLEASLDAVDRELAKTSGKKRVKQTEAKRAEAGNSLMDRKGGGPLKWNEFYGTTAEKFFYHPVDPQTTYRTSTLLKQMGSQQDDKLVAGVPSTQSVPAHQRPPQFDYIYRANRDAKEQAERDAAGLAGKIEELKQWRTQLEDEQSGLWCRLAFRAIERLSIPRKPTLRFRLVARSSAPADVQRTAALTAAARFLAVSLLIIDKAEEDQSVALSHTTTVVAKARQDLEDSLLDLDVLADDASNRATILGKYVALAQLLEDTSANLSDSHAVSSDRGTFADIERRNRFRGLLQRSLVEYATILLALDELVSAMKTEWEVGVDTKNRAISAVAERPNVAQPEVADPLPPGAQPLIGRWTGDSDLYIRDIGTDGSFRETRPDGQKHSAGRWSALPGGTGIEIDTDHGYILRVLPLGEGKIEIRAQFKDSVRPDMWKKPGQVLRRAK